MNTFAEYGEMPCVRRTIPTAGDMHTGLMGNMPRVFGHIETGATGDIFTGVKK